MDLLVMVFSPFELEWRVATFILPEERKPAESKRKRSQVTKKRNLATLRYRGPQAGYDLDTSWLRFGVTWLRFEAQPVKLVATWSRPGYGLARPGRTLHLSYGEIVCTDTSERLIVHVRLNNPDAFMDTMCGNHYVLSVGDLRPQLRLLCEWLGITVHET